MLIPWGYGILGFDPPHPSELSELRLLACSLGGQVLPRRLAAGRLPGTRGSRSGPPKAGSGSFFLFIYIYIGIYLFVSGPLGSRSKSGIEMVDPEP